jgi:nucleotide-binding universal stress UspA family protein
MTSARTVVIGIDDSAPSRAALTWAAEYARTTGDSLEAVHVMNPEVDSPLAWMPGFPTMVYIAETPPREVQQKRISQFFEAVLPEPHWRLRFLEGPVGATLVNRSKTAALLVVGTHEHVGFGRLVNGSVSHYCLTRAACPVVAVPPSRSADPSPQHGP